MLNDFPSERVRLQRELETLDFLLPSLISSPVAQEADVLQRLFAARVWSDCPWYIVDLDPELISFVDEEALLWFLAGYVAFGKEDNEVFQRFKWNCQRLNQRSRIDTESSLVPKAAGLIQMIDLFEQ